MNFNINMNGIYSHRPTSLYSKHDDMFWCQNWTFIPEEYNGKIFMRDTYWLGSLEGMAIEVTEQNYKEFDLLFDRTEFEETNIEHCEEYDVDDCFRIPYGSGGFRLLKVFLKKGALRNKDKVIKRLSEEILSLSRTIEYKNSIIVALENGNIQPHRYI